ncbi:hypothetical protein ACFJX4_13725, partial [Enterococcus faecalis]
CTKIDNNKAKYAIDTKFNSKTRVKITRSNVKIIGDINFIYFILTSLYLSMLFLSIKETAFYNISI